MKRSLIIGGICVALVSWMIGVCAADPIVNVGRVKYADPETGKVTVKESEPAVINGPYLTITKTANKKEVRPGEAVEYTITVKNVGTREAKDVLISDKFPDELQLIDCKGIIYDEQGNVVEEVVITSAEWEKAQEDMQKMQEGEIVIKREGKMCSISIRKGSTVKEMLIERFGYEYVVRFIQRGRL